MGWPAINWEALPTNDWAVALSALCRAANERLEATNTNPILFETNGEPLPYPSPEDLSGIPLRAYSIYRNLFKINDTINVLICRWYFGEYTPKYVVGFKPEVVASRGGDTGFEGGIDAYLGLSPGACDVFNANWWRYLKEALNAIKYFKVKTSGSYRREGGRGNVARDVPVEDAYNPPDDFPAAWAARFSESGVWGYGHTQFVWMLGGLNAGFRFYRRSSEFYDPPMVKLITQAGGFCDCEIFDLRGFAGEIVTQEERGEVGVGVSHGEVGEYFDEDVRDDVELALPVPFTVTTGAGNTVAFPSPQFYGGILGGREGYLFSTSDLVLGREIERTPSLNFGITQAPACIRRSEVWKTYCGFCFEITPGATTFSFDISSVLTDQQ